MIARILPHPLLTLTLVVVWQMLVNYVSLGTLVSIPLDLRTPEAITVLAGTITMTPGTVSSDVAADGRSLLVHCLDAPDPDAVRDEIKQRYERRLKEIFE